MSSSSATGLPAFSAQDVQLQKVESRNALSFALPARSSLLLRVAAPRVHAYEERDFRWLHLLQAVAIVPSRKVETIVKLVQQAIKLQPQTRFRRALESSVRTLLSALSNPASKLSVSNRALLTLRLKDQVAAFLREWMADPIEGMVTRKEHVVGGMRMDDLVATPMGIGYLRAYRREDRFCVVLYPWGHGFIHVSNVEKLAEAIDHERKRRRSGEYHALEHQRLFEQIESLLENASAAEAPEPVDIDAAEYRQLIQSLKDEHFDANVLDHDLSLMRRVQAVTSRLKRPRTLSESDAPAPTTAADGDAD
ncbi:hypothetical protein ATCC90586_005902 [Pythium insidiosum]|nr:hypothetical protein ATCC90586_005902 [Pythium insidiosum]